MHKKNAVSFPDDARGRVPLSVLNILGSCHWWAALPETSLRYLFIK